MALLLPPDGADVFAAPRGVRFDWDAERLRLLANLINELEPKLNSFGRTHSEFFIDARSPRKHRYSQAGSRVRPWRRRGRRTRLRGSIAICAAISRTPSATGSTLRCRFSPKVTCNAVGHSARKTYQPFGILRQVMEKLPLGDIRTCLDEIPTDRTALGYVEGWRGEIFHWVRTARGLGIHFVASPRHADMLWALAR